MNVKMHLRINLIGGVVLCYSYTEWYQVPPVWRVASDSLLSLQTITPPSVGQPSTDSSAQCIAMLPVTPHASLQVHVTFKFTDFTETMAAETGGGVGRRHLPLFLWRGMPILLHLFLLLPCSLQLHRFYTYLTLAQNFFKIRKFRSYAYV